MTLLPEWVPGIILFGAVLGIVFLLVFTKELFFNDEDAVGAELICSVSSMMMLTSAGSLFVGIEKDHSNWGALKGIDYEVRSRSFDSFSSASQKPSTAAVPDKPWKLGDFVIKKSSMTLVGRSQQCNIVLTSEKVSGRHALIQFRARDEGVVYDF